MAEPTASMGTNLWKNFGAFASSSFLSPTAVPNALKVALTYATPNCVVVRGDSALRLVKLTCFREGVVWLVIW